MVGTGRWENERREDGNGHRDTGGCGRAARGWRRSYLRRQSVGGKKAVKIKERNMKIKSPNGQVPHVIRKLAPRSWHYCCESRGREVGVIAGVVD
ncbi:hypothetical protein C2845_PM06G12340 [Panicum miliaceum]|uniref:Uncharacterized protein n=1 Tax=Panicum miliaceum TaxID=4540 RepID=A0A3L6RF65_PANMI|nr:hypothetical protein C2845_PM06G12340 [Panicum miliaceum]